ncbi:MAG: sulfatase family protein [Pirellulaceae bacterium]
MTVVALLLLAAQAADANRPNFLWLISEDNSVHSLKLYDPQGAETPRIAQLASQGLVFDHAFCNAPVCSVARSTLITSCYAPRIGTQFHRRHVPVPLPDGVRMFPAYLRDAGYYTTNNAKKDYNAIEGDGVWDVSSNTASWRHRQPGQPFFHQLTLGITHESALHFPEGDIRARRTQTDPDSIVVAPYHPDTPVFRYTYARYDDCVRQLDTQIGTVVDQLAADGLLEDTFIFYFADNGGALPRSKAYAYDNGLHVPLVIRIPENWAHLVPWRVGSRVPGFVSFVDFGPTLLHVAGIPVPEQVDGRPFLGVGVTAAEVNARDEAFGSADRFDEKYDLVRTVRQGRYEYVRSYQPFNVDALQNNYRYQMLAYAQWRELYKSDQLNATQRQFFERRTPEALFDLEVDPHELNNLAGDPQYAKVLARLRARTTQWAKEMPDLSFFPETALVESAFHDPAGYGLAHRHEIAELVDIANLSLLEFDIARPALARALASTDTWQRYWGLIVCSCFGESARPFVEQAKELAQRDEHLLVRTRAAEFLGLLGASDPRPIIKHALARSRSAVEVALILNSVILLQDGKPGYEFGLSREDLDPSVYGDENVRSRMAYLRVNLR